MSAQQTPPIPGPVAQSGWNGSREVPCEECRVRLDRHTAAHQFRVTGRPA